MPCLHEEHTYTLAHSHTQHSTTTTAAINLAELKGIKRGREEKKKGKKKKRKVLGSGV